MDTAIIQLTVNADETLFCRYYHFAWRHTPLAVLKDLLLLLLIFPAALFALLTALVGSEINLLHLLALCAGLCWAAGGIALLHRPHLLWRNHHKAQLQPKTYAVYEDHILMQGGTAHSRTTADIQYEHFSTVFETRHAFFLPTSLEVHCLSKDSLRQEEIAALRALLGRKYGEGFKGMGD